MSAVTRPEAIYPDDHRPYPTAVAAAVTGTCLCGQPIHPSEWALRTGRGYGHQECVLQYVADAMGVSR